MARRGTYEKRADRLNRLSVAPDDAPNVGPPHGDAKDRRISVWALRDDDFVGKLNQIAEHELEELFHGLSVTGVTLLSPPP